MPAHRSNTEKILSRLKGLARHLQPNEETIATFPAIWDNGQGPSSTLCDVVITNQRVIGFYFRSFPREKLFFDAISLSNIKNITFRQKSHEPVFRELLISEEERKIYIRAPHKKIADLYSALRAATDQYGSTSHAQSLEEQTTEATSTQRQGSLDERQEDIDGRSGDVNRRQGQAQPLQQVVYERQEIQKPFETSITAVVLLFVGGIVLEVVGVLLWSATQDSQIGLPLCIAGFIAVGASIWLRRKQG